MHSLAQADLRPGSRSCIELFGAERCMFASNFPVDAMYGGFDELLGSVRAATDGLRTQERRAVCGERPPHLRALRASSGPEE